MNIITIKSAETGEVVEHVASYDRLKLLRWFDLNYDMSAYYYELSAMYNIDWDENCGDC